MKRKAVFKIYYIMTHSLMILFSSSKLCI